MANTRSALKRIKTSEKRRVRNAAVKSSTRTFVKKARTAIAQTPAEAQADILAAISALDRAAKKGVIHANNAARRKSRLMKAFNNAIKPKAEEAATDAPAKKTARRSSGRKAASATAKPAARTRKPKAES